jgi:formylglycine-generating enzyme required for sulfatase activity
MYKKWSLRYVATIVLIMSTSACQSITPASTFTPMPTSTTLSTNTLFPTNTLLPTSTYIPSPTETPTPAGTPLPDEITDSKGVTMRFVPAGEFTMGDTTDQALAECQKFRSSCQRDWFINEEPPHTVYLDAYYMDKYEVTNALYAACVKAGTCPIPTKRPIKYDNNSAFDNYPVFVDWNMANTYCKWRGGQLPTEAQWEKAARGTDGRTYPWGEEIDCNKANYWARDGRGGSCVGDTTAVGSYESGKSPYGIYDLAGNVWEWVADWYDATYYQNSPLENPLGPSSGQKRVLRGGAWNVSNVGARSAYRGGEDPMYLDFFIGFRCSRSP